MAQAATAPKRVLVADDDAVLRHALSELFRAAGFAVVAVADGQEALETLGRDPCDLLLLDINMPRVSGLEVLKRLRQSHAPPKIVVMTSDNTPETVLQSLREQACDYIGKPFPPADAVEFGRRALESAATPFEIVSARPEWVELLIPCERNAAERIQGFMDHMKADLEQPLRNQIGQAFRELLLNAIEWGGKLDATRKVRIACIRTPRLLLYRIADPGPGFSFNRLDHAAVAHPGDPVGHVLVREEKGLRPGGFGILMTRAMVDELVYNEAQNEVMFLKHL